MSVHEKLENIHGPPFFEAPGLSEAVGSDPVTVYIDHLIEIAAEISRELFHDIQQVKTRLSGGDKYAWFFVKTGENEQILARFEVVPTVNNSKYRYPDKMEVRMSLEGGARAIIALGLPIEPIFKSLDFVE